MSRRTKILTIALGALIVLMIIATAVPVPLVALSPGPTFNTLGAENGKPVVTVTGRPVYPTTGHLNMTTVLVNEPLNALNMVYFWLLPHFQLLPRSMVYPPGVSTTQVTQLNNLMFTSSESNAKTVAYDYVHIPMKVLVGEITAGSAAAGVLKVGDQILALNGAPVTSASQLSQLLVPTRPGQQVQVRYQRGNIAATQPVTLGARPPALPGPQGFLGIGSVNQLFDPNQVQISLAGVGGPSAGLMFTLAVLDKITPDNLTGGRFIAGTGTIDPAGNVGKISGIPLKMIAARQQGATHFLVPAGDCTEAQPAAPDGLTLIKVNTLADAVNALNNLKAGRPVPGC